jgi:hypothetical protein
METISYKGWTHCIRLANASVELVITGDVGPRIIRFAFLNQPNEFYEDAASAGKSGDSEFHAYGGHRFWRAPEDPVLTYVPDNRPVSVEAIRDGAHLTPPPETSAGIQKEWFVRLDPGQAHARVTHRLTNIGSKPMVVAPWALSVMASGGTAVLPLPPRGPHDEKNLLPTCGLILWAYTNLSDPRWGWGEKYIRLQQDPRSPKAQKIGALVPDGWAAYCRQNHLFVKLFPFPANANYPDMGSSAEFFTNAEIVEVETLGPLLPLSPGQSAEHTEDWFLFEGVPSPKDDADIDRTILPKVEWARRAGFPSG